MGASGNRRLALALIAALVAIAPLASGCRERAARLLGVDAAPGSAPRAIEEPHEVHFTFTGPDAVTFNWRGHDATARYWATGMPPRTVIAKPPKPVPAYAKGPFQEVTLSGLLPGSEVRYQLGNPERPLSLSFRAPPARGATGFSFVAVGDIGASNDLPGTRVLHRQIAIVDPSFVIGLGDLTYADTRAPATIARHFEDAMAWSGRSAYMPVWGNHEWETGRDDLRNYKGRFALPNAAASPGAPLDGCCGEDWYWFDHGAVRVIAYPEPYGPDTWPDWAAKAEAVFAAAEADPALQFVITAGHRGAYSSGVRGGEATLRTILDGFGRRFSKYVLNLSGHEHVYERTKPQAHVVHVTAGIGGAGLQHAPTACYWTTCQLPPFTAARAIHHGFVKVTVQPEALQVEAICGPESPGSDEIRCAEGDVFDRAVIDAPKKQAMDVTKKRR